MGPAGGHGCRAAKGDRPRRLHSALCSAGRPRSRRWVRSGQVYGKRAKLGAAVTALDLSEGQLELARATVVDAGLSDAVDAFVAADIADLSMFPDGHFDAVICYGGALSYVCERRDAAAAELVRVVRPGGILLCQRHEPAWNHGRPGPTPSDVRSRGSGALARMGGRQRQGDLPGFPAPGMDLEHPAMHMYTSDELRRLLPDCRVLDLAGSNVTTSGESSAPDDILGQSGGVENGRRA